MWQVTFVLRPPITVNVSVALIVTTTIAGEPVAGVVHRAPVVVLAPPLVPVGLRVPQPVPQDVLQRVRAAPGVRGAVVQVVRVRVQVAVVPRAVAVVLADAPVVLDRIGKVCPLPSILFYTHGGYCDITPTDQRQAGKSGRLYPNR